MTTMRVEHGTSHDQHRRLFCAPAAADQHLASLAQVKAWFGILTSEPKWVLKLISHFFSFFLKSLRDFGYFCKK